MSLKRLRKREPV